MISVTCDMVGRWLVWGVVIGLAIAAIAVAHWHGFQAGQNDMKRYLEVEHERERLEARRKTRVD